MSGKMILSSPRDALALLRALGAVPWLIRHHDLVGEAAGLIVAGLRGVRFDRGAVLIGAALHDAGKIVCPDEISAPGHRHEEAGRDLLLAHGVPAELARFCVTHAAWQGGTLEDHLVALADKLWKGKRDEALERSVVDLIAMTTGEEPWQVFERVDALCEAVTADGDDRLARSSTVTADELTRTIRANDEARLARIAKAKAEAPPGKEPLDVAFIKRSSRTGALGMMSDDELVVTLEDMYYVDHPSYRTNQQLVDLIHVLANYD